ncbi:MAG TPA: flagellar biosynthesis anti-sigma factor FlgM [Rhodanobacteraceae bacterium]|nr:flagellar biosynthesis anti-sigma factor FlgM [Rhodanobacteraceae bacterium]
MNTITQSIGSAALGATPDKAGSAKTSGDSANQAAQAANGPAAPSVDVEATLSSQSATQASPGVDAAKVARLRNAIATGSYHVDAQRTAKNLLNMEHALGQP